MFVLNHIKDRMDLSIDTLRVQLKSHLSRSRGDIVKNEILEKTLTRQKDRRETIRHNNNDRYSFNYIKDRP
jgi:hypothetical protein